MASIERLQAPVQTGSNQPGKGIEDSSVSMATFTQILGEIQQSISPLASSQEQTELLEMGIVEDGNQESPEWTQEQWQEVLAMLKTFFQVLNQSSESISGSVENGLNQPTTHSLLLTQEGMESIGLKLEKGPLSSISEVLSIIHKMGQNETEIPRDVANQFDKIMKILGPSTSKGEAQEPFSEMISQSPHENKVVSWQLGQGSGVLRFQPIDKSQSVSLEGMDTGTEAESEGPSTGAMPIFSGSGLLRIQSQQVKPVPYAMNSENFVPEMTEFLVSKIKISPLTGGTEARVSLSPEHLGQLDMRISMQQGQMVAQFIAESAVARDMLESNLSALRSALQQQGIQVGKIDIQTAAQAGLMNQHQQPQGQPGSYQQNQKSKRTSTVSGMEQLGTEGGAAVYDHMQSYGSSIVQPSNKNIDFTA